jgi:hypothetical protein
VRHVEGPAVPHPIDEGLGGTNGAAQSGLETISMLGFVGDRLPVTTEATQPAARATPAAPTAPATAAEAGNGSD